MGFILLLGSIHIPGLFKLEKSKIQPLQASGFFDVLVRCVKLYLNPIIGQSVDDEWYPSKIIDLGIFRLHMLEFNREETLKKYLKLHLKDVRAAPSIKKGELINQFYRDRYLCMAFSRGGINRRPLLTRVLHLETIIPVLSWVNSGKNVPRLFKKALRIIGVRFKLFRSAVSSLIFLLSALIILALRPGLGSLLGFTIFFLILIASVALAILGVLSFTSLIIRLYWVWWEEKLYNEMLREKGFSLKARGRNSPERRSHK